MAKFQYIAEAWKRSGVHATRERVRLAIKVTKNPYGITLGGVPYMRPKVGMRVRVSPTMLGTITALKTFGRDRDPQAVIDTDDGQRPRLFQTALCGYVVIGEVEGSTTHKEG